MRQEKIKPLADYLRPDKGRIDFDDEDALGAALDRLVAMHAARDGISDRQAGK